MIPPFNHSHVLPPFVGDDPTAVSNASPYRASMLEIVERFVGLPRRRQLLQGLLAYRADLAALGFVRGFQWLDGSFAEDVEAHEERPPNDIDMVTFAFSPAGLTSGEINELIADHPTVFNNAMAKEKYGCDGYVVPLDKSPENLVKRTAYYLSLFSHRRGDHVWKGLLQVPLESDDPLARDLLQTIA